MKEGPEALVGGPPLNLFVGPALRAFRLRLPGRDTPPLLWRTCCSLTLSTGTSHPRLPSKGFSAAAQLTCGGFLVWEVSPGRETGRVRKEKEMKCAGRASGPVSWLLFRPILQPLPSDWSL